MNIVITGGTGLIGTRLAAAFAAEHDVRILSRRPGASVAKGVSVKVWRPESGGPPSALAGVDAVVHLAGSPIAQRWTENAKRRIRESRVGVTRQLVQSLGALERRPALLVSASAIGIYGDRGDEPITEASRPGTGFLPGVCAAWEHEANAASRMGIRVVNLRLGIVLAREGGALAKMLPAFRAGVGGRLGTGVQWMSWIHIDDVIALVRFVIERELSGPVNATAPEPVRNSEFTRALAAALHRPAVMPVPAFALRLLLGEMSQVLLESQKVFPEAAQSAGYSFQYPSLPGALAQILSASTAAKPR